MIFAHGDGAKMKLVSRKLDNLGYIKSYGGVKNYPECLHQLKKNIEFSPSLAMIDFLEQRDTQQAKGAIDPNL